MFMPSEKMTWGMLGTTIKGISDFVSDWEFVDFDFEIQELGYSSNVGSGLLVYI